MVRLHHLAEVAKTWSGMKRDTAGSGFGPRIFARAKALSVGLSNTYFKSLGLPLLADECSRNLSNRRVRTRIYSDLLGDIVSGVNTPGTRCPNYRTIGER